ncbi:MAG: tetratricopeptide repeat protein [Candidatus Competibacterales bacterium]
MSDWLWLLLPVAAASGFWMAKREASPGKAWSPEGRGPLDFQLDQPDHTVAATIANFSIAPDTADSYITLGKVFRQRGELNWAIHLHRHLSTLSQLSVDQRHAALVELGEDYLSAGLLDRAEAVFRQFSPTHRQQRCGVTALERLMVIAEQQQDWPQALDGGERLLGLGVRRVAKPVAHYHCELADGALARGEPDVAHHHLQRALRRDERCVRASLTLGELALAKGDPTQAVAVLQRVEYQDSRFMPLALAPLIQGYTALYRRAELLEYLRGLQRRHPAGTTMMACAELMAEDGQRDLAVAWLESELRHRPSSLALRYLLQLRLVNDQGHPHPEWATCHAIVMDTLPRGIPYVCDHCGFELPHLQWRCGRCGAWGGLVPREDATSPARVSRTPEVATEF